MKGRIYMYKDLDIFFIFLLLDGMIMANFIDDYLRYGRWDPATVELQSLPCLGKFYGGKKIKREISKINWTKT